MIFKQIPVWVLYTRSVLSELSRALEMFFKYFIGFQLARQPSALVYQTHCLSVVSDLLAPVLGGHGREQLGGTGMWVWKSILYDQGLDSGMSKRIIQ